MTTRQKYEKAYTFHRADNRTRRLMCKWDDYIRNNVYGTPDTTFLAAARSAMRRNNKFRGLSLDMKSRVQRGLQFAGVRPITPVKVNKA